MDLERRLYEALRLNTSNPGAPRPDLFVEPPAGIVRQTQFGPIWMVETFYDEGYLHGRVELSRQFFDSALKILDPHCHRNGFRLDNTAVLDTETTGLAGGTGTYAFIIGIGFWKDNRFVVRQYILRDFFEEPAQLNAIKNDLDGLSALLTYNGKSFDIPLLRTRYRINRQEIPFENHLHLDFIHPCRRLFKKHFEALNLTQLEAQMLGYERLNDVPSHLIPRLYFDYLQNRDDKLLLPILNHNREDIISLFVLAQETFRQVDLALSGVASDDLLLLSLGRILYRSGNYELSREILSNIKVQFASREIKDEMLSLSSAAAKKMKDWDSAAGIWARMMTSGRFGCHPHIELAKYHERRLKDHKRALDLTNMAMKLVEFERDFMDFPAYKSLMESLAQRRKRLQAKLDAD